MPKFRTVDYQEEEGIALVTLNRPEKLNAFNIRMRDELLEVLDIADADDCIRAIIFTGAGRGFCAGADLSSDTTFDFQAPGACVFGPDGTIDYNSPRAREGGGLLALRLLACLKPMIAAVNGVAVGVGATMILPMDVRLASTQARFGFPFAQRATVPESASSWFLPRVVGISRALDWCFSGRIFDAMEAREADLVRSLHQPEDLLDAARRIARSYVEGAPVSIALTRQMLWRGLIMTHPMEAHRIDSRGLLSRFNSNDGREGLAAFLEKRAPDYSDRVSSDMPDFFPWWNEPTYE